MKIHTLLIVTMILIMDKANGGVIEGVYDKVSNTTQAMKDDVYSWWSYGVDTIMGDNTVYSKVKGGVSSGYMKIHDLVLGKDSDPNKGIIKTLYERAMKKLSEIKAYVFGALHPVDKPESQANDEAVNEQVLKLLFDDKTNIFNTESEKLALDSLRKKLTQTGDEVLNIADNERELIKKAYNSIHHKFDEFLTSAGQSVDGLKNKVNESIEKTQEFIQDASKKADETAQNVGNDMKKTTDDIEKKVQSE